MLRSPLSQDRYKILLMIYFLIYRNLFERGLLNIWTSSPGHQQSNGKAEAAVKIVKTLMKKTVKDGRDQFEALLEQRNTPRQDTGLIHDSRIEDHCHSLQ
jgi:transposase InsO family protein